MIAKAILEMFTALPTASRPAAETSGQPLQAFSDSLLAASKSFLQGNATNDGSGKTGRRQRSASDDAKAPSVAFDGSAVPQLIAFQQTQEVRADSSPLQTQSGVPIVADERLSVAAGQLTRDLAPVGLAETESGITQQTGVHTSFTAMQLPAAGPATTQVSLTNAASRPARNLPSMGLTEIQTIVAHESIDPTRVAPSIGAQSKIAAVTIPLAGPATIQDTPTGKASPITRTLSSMGLTEIHSSVAQPGIQTTSTVLPAGFHSSLTPAQMPLARPATTQWISPSQASQLAWNVTAARLPETETSVVLPTVVQSSAIPVQLPLGRPATTQSNSTEAAVKPTLNASTPALAETQTSRSQTIVASTNIVRPAVVQSSVTPLQMHFASSATIQDASTAVAGQPTWRPSTTAPAEIQTNLSGTFVAPANVVRSDVAQPSVTNVQIPPPVPATREDNVAEAAVKPTLNVSTPALAETQTAAAPASIAPTDIVSSAVVQSNLAFVPPVRVPIAGLATTEDTPTGVASQPTWNTSMEASPETHSTTVPASIAPTNMPQPAAVDSNPAPAQVPFAKPAISQEIPIGVKGQTTQNVTAASDPETESSIIPTIVVPANIVLPAVAQSIFTPAQKPVAGTATAQATSAGPAGHPTRNVAAAEWIEVQSSVALPSFVPVSLAQPSVVQSSLTKVQMPLADMAATHNTSTGPASQPARNMTAAALAETRAGAALANNSQPAVAQSSFAQVPISLVDPTTSQDNSTGPSSLPLQGMTAAKPAENESSVAQTNIFQPAVVQSNVTLVRKPLTALASTQNSSTELAAQPMQDVQATVLVGTQAGVARKAVDQRAHTESKFIPVETPLAVTATTQEASTGLASQPARNEMARTSETESSIAPTGNASIIVSQPSAVPASVLQRTIAPLAPIQSSATPLQSDPSQSPSNLPGTRIQQQKAPTAVSSKSASVDTSATATSIPDTTAAQDNARVEGSLPTASMNTLSNAVQNTVANDPTEPTPAPALRAALIASTRDVTAPALKADSTVQTNPRPAAPDQSLAATTISVPGGIADQLATSPFGVNEISVTGLKSASATKLQAAASRNDKEAGTDQTGLKKSAEPASAKESKASSQDATPSGDQSQGGNTPQAQETVPVPIISAVHSAAVIASVQHTPTASPLHTSPAPADAAQIAAKMTDHAAHTPASLPQALPVINTAKLIQSMGQSEMRVGMRSNEFGNISISTSTTRDQVSAQISLEHGELAKTLAAHLPEMQSRLGSNQAMDVRIDMNGAATGQGTGTFGGTSHGSSDQSRSGRQQAGNMAASASVAGVAEKQFSSVAGVMPTSYARLDIRV